MYGIVIFLWQIFELKIPYCDFQLFWCCKITDSNGRPRTSIVSSAHTQKLQLSVCIFFVKMANVNDIFRFSLKWKKNVFFYFGIFFYFERALGTKNTIFNNILDLLSTNSIYTPPTIVIFWNIIKMEDNPLKEVKALVS